MPAVEDQPSTDLKELMSLLHRDERQEVHDDNLEILAVIRSLGGSRSRYRRERHRALKRVVSEIYPTPRVTAATKLLLELKLIPGFSLDLTTVDERGRRLDFNMKVMRDEALRRVREERPLLLVGSPMCSAFST